MYLYFKFISKLEKELFGILMYQFFKREGLIFLALHKQRSLSRSILLNSTCALKKKKEREHFLIFGVRGKHFIEISFCMIWHKLSRLVYEK